MRGSIEVTDLNATALVVILSLSLSNATSRKSPLNVRSDQHARGCLNESGSADELNTVGQPMDGPNILMSSQTSFRIASAPLAHASLPA